MSRKKAAPASSAEATTDQQPGTELAPVTAPQTIESETPASAETAGNGPGVTTGQEAQPNQLSAGDVIAQLAGLLDQEGNIVALKDIPEEQLRKLAEDMDISGHDTLPVEQLVQLIEGDTVVVSAVSYTVNRERLDHDGDSYTYGDPIEFSDPAQAEALLKLGAIQENE